MVEIVEWRRVLDTMVSSALAGNLIRAGHAVCWYSWRMPPRRSCRRTHGADPRSGDRADRRCEPRCQGGHRRVRGTEGTGEGPHFHQFAPGRYRQHDLLCLYTAEQAHRTARQEERDAALRRRADSYLYTARKAEQILHPHRTKIEFPEPPADCLRLALTDQQKR